MEIKPAPAPAVAAGEARPPARPLIPVTLALIAGLLAGAWGVRLPGLWVGVGLGALWVLMVVMWARGGGVRVAPLAFFWLLGVAFYGQALHPFFPPHHLVHLPQDQELAIRGRLDRPARVGPERVQLFVKAEAWHGLQGWRPATGRLLVSAPALKPPAVGEEVILRGKLRVPRAFNNPGAADRARYLAADAIFRQLSLRQEDDLVVLAGSGAPPLREQLRGGIRQLLEELPPALKAMYLAILLGDQGEITPAMRRNFSRTGTSHLLVINGMHLSAAAGVTYFLIFWLLRCFPWLLLRVNAMKVATAGAAGTVVAYAWMAGGSPSTQRAEIMVLAYLLLVFLGRPREVWSALALAALVILSLNPLRLFAISFQLSFAAVAAILYLVPRWLPLWREESGDRGEAPGFLARLGRRGREMLAVSLAASLATAPLVADYFQVVSVLGALVNLAAIPLVLMLALPLGEVAVLAHSLGLTPVAQVFIFLGKWPLWMGYEAISTVARLPGSALILSTPTWLQIALFYFLLIMVFPRRRTWVTWGGAGLAGVLLALTVALPALNRPGALEVTVLDSPAGLDGVVVTPDNRRLAFSAGWPTWPGQEVGAGAGGALPNYLHWRQFRQLDEVAALTLTARNAPELTALAEQFEMGSVWLGGGGDRSPAVMQLRNLLGDLGRPARSLEKGRPPQTLGAATLMYLSLPGGKGVALLLEYQGRRVLLFPPAPQAAGEGLSLPHGAPLEAAVVPWEPSGGLLARLQPRQVVIYGRGRSPATPKEGTLARYYTREGAVTLFMGQAETAVRQWGKN